MLDVPDGEMTEAEQVCYDAGWLTPLQATTLRDALAACEAWLSGWAQHAGRCGQVGGPCTCGLVAIRAEASGALALCPTPAPAESSTRTGEQP